MKKKSTSQQERPRFQTRKGTKPNTAGEKLVTIKNGDDVRRVTKSKAAEYLRFGWYYCPKSEYKNK